MKTATQLRYESHHPDFFFYFLSYCTSRTQNWSLYPCICGARNFILQNDGKLFSFHSTKLQVRKSALLKEFEVRSCHETSLNTYIAYVTFFFPNFWESFSPVITLGTRRALSYHPTKHHLEGLQHKNWCKRCWLFQNLVFCVVFDLSACLNHSIWQYHLSDGKSREVTRWNSLDIKGSI